MPTPAELAERFNTKASEELEAMLLQPDLWTEDARTAAKAELKRRNAGVLEGRVFASPARSIPNMVNSRTRPPFLVYVLPSLHLIACFYVQVAGLEWMPLIIADLPFSLLLMPLLMTIDGSQVLIGTLGTLWWFGLSWAGWRLLAAFAQNRAGGTTPSR